MGEKRRGIGESTLLLPGFESRGRRDVWFEFAAAFLSFLSEEFYFGFKSSAKTNIIRQIPILPGVVAQIRWLLIICVRARHWREYSPSNMRPGFKSRRRGFVLWVLYQRFAPFAFNFPLHYYLSDIVTSGLLWLVSFTLLRILIILLARMYRGTEASNSSSNSCYMEC